MKKSTIRKIEFFLHFLTSVVLILKGYNEIMQGKYFPGFIILSLALLVPVLLVLWRPLQITPKQSRVACYYIEAPALFVTAYVLHIEGREFHLYVFLIAGILYPVAGFISSKKFRRLKKLS